MNVNINTSASDKVMHKKHETTQHIPTIVNGELIETVNSEVELFNASNKESTRILWVI